MHEVDLETARVGSRANSVVSQWYPSLEAIMLFGSAARGAWREESDIDIVVFLPEVICPHHEHRQDDGWLFDIYVHDVTSFLRELARQRLAYSCYYSNVLRFGRFITDKSSVERKLKNSSAYLSHSLRRRPNLGPSRLAIASLMRKVKKTGHPGYVASCMDLHHAVLTSSLLVRGGCVGNNAVMMDLMSEIDGDFARSLTEAFQQCVAGNPAGLSDIAGAVLEALGGKIPDGERSYL
jgi:predicted nucleotidyltransferase